ncbi:MAG: sulfotransferase domain-containing protein [Anaerolineales bacterium]|nr:sulfotransferase domain-containing protein [Anaerolineales bacterium]
MPIIQSIRRTLRPYGKTAQAILRWKRFSFHEAPPIFGNSKPKSGSHLLTQILNGFTKIMPYKYVDAEPIRTIEKDGRRKPKEEILVDLQAIPNGVIGWGYVDATKENVSFLTSTGRVNYFMYRDPRDMLVSQVFFATDMHEEHGMHNYYKSLPDFGARLNVAITGIDKDGLHMVSVKQRYESVFQWLDVSRQKNVMCIRFEELINNRENTLNAMISEVEKTGYVIPIPRAIALAVLVDAIQPKKSHTFRAGKTGGWKEHFFEEHKKLFKDVAGDLLVQLGYEKNNDW